MKRKPSFYVVLGVLAAAVVCVLIILAVMNRDGMIIRRQSDHFAFYCYKRQAQQASALAEQLEAVYATTLEDLGIKSAGTIAIIIHPSPDDMRRAVGLADGEDLPAAMLVQGEVHICCTPGDDEQLHSEALAYQVVRRMVHTTIGTDETFALADALAAFEARGRELASTRAGISAEAAPLPSVVTGAPSTPYYEDFFSQPNSQYAYLYAAFLTFEEEGTGLLKTLRGGSPIRFKRATGYEEAHWDALWRQWLAQGQIYSSQP
ncbi:MAG: hypothetical protein PHO66_05190 [Eubacteriales bacterium]|nr:hypothetical protein [Eubacteriales bacterium]